MATKSQIQSYLQLPQVKAALDTIAWAEGANYNTLFGGGTFSDFSRHPNRCIPYKNTCSTAAGRYQFLKGTWDSLNLPDFSPTNQDIGAVMLIDRRGALSKVVSGDFQGAITSGALGKEWASLPYSPYGQPVRSLSQIISKYQSFLANRGGASIPIDNNGNIIDGGNLATVTISADDEETNATWLVLGALALAFIL